MRMKRTVTCAWYALCNKPAAGVASHPILRWVPICERCAEKHDLYVRKVCDHCKEPLWSDAHGWYVGEDGTSDCSAHERGHAVKGMLA